MDDDRRRDPRQPAENLKARVRFADKKQFERCYLKDISRGGIFLRTQKPAPLDAPVEAKSGRSPKTNSAGQTTTVSGHLHERGSMADRSRRSEQRLVQQLNG